MSFATPPAPVPLGGGRTVLPQEMLAVRTKSSCSVNIGLDNGGSMTASIPEGSLGYLVQREGAQSLVQIMRSTGQRGLCEFRP